MAVQSIGIEMPQCLHGTNYTGAMATRESLPAAERRRFQTGRSCLDFTHTGGDGPFARWELLHSADDAARYLGIVLDCGPPVIRSSDLGTISRLRAAVTVIARSLAANVDAPYPATAVAALNAAAAHPPLEHELSADHRRIVQRGDARQACSTLARDAIELFSSPLRHRVRICGADDCELLFVDASRPGRRRWCSMDWCGDRQKKRRAGRSLRETEE